MTSSKHSEIFISFGKKIAKERIALGLSQSEVSAKLNMPQSTYGGYESGARKVPLDVIKDIAALFNVSVDYLLEDALESAKQTNVKELIPIKKEFHLTDEEKQLILAFRQSDSIDKAIVLRSLGIDKKGGNSSMVNLG